MKKLMVMACGCAALAASALELAAWRGETVTLPIDAADFEARPKKLIATSRYQKPSQRSKSGKTARKSAGK